MRITPTSSPTVLPQFIKSQSVTADTSGSLQTTAVQADLSPQAQLETLAQVAIKHAVGKRNQQVETLTTDMRQGINSSTSDSLAVSLVLQQNSGGNGE